MKYVEYAVIPVAGQGLRLLPITRGIPKEMLPLFTVVDTYEAVKPIIHLIFEQITSQGITNICFIVNSEKDCIKRYFTKDDGYQVSVGMVSGAIESDMTSFMDSLTRNCILFIKQETPRGFGDAILRAREDVQTYPFLVHAGDELILSQNHFERLENVFIKYSADAVFIVRESQNANLFGVVEGTYVEDNVIQVHNVVEKPESPKSNLVVVAIYLFSKMIFNALERIDVNDSLELTAGIQHLLKLGGSVYGILLEPTDLLLETGSIKGYSTSLEKSLKIVQKTRRFDS